MIEHSPKQRPTIAVILAGGVGSRLGLGTPKQLIPVAGKNSLEHTVEVFNSCDGIETILVMMEPNHLIEAQSLLECGRFPKLKRIIAGGATRNETSQLALAQIHDPEAKVLFHDAVRPLVDHRIIEDCISALDNFDAVDTAVASADTIIEVNTNSEIVAVPQRSALRRGQTPQGFRQRTLSEAYKIAALDPHFEATDDCSVVLNYLPKTPIYVVEGSNANIKITEPIDIHLVDKLFQLRGVDPPESGLPAGSLANAHVVIFGASSGIGDDLSTYLLAAGATVHGFSRRENDVDIQNREDVRAALAQAERESGAIDHVVVSAGVLFRGPLTSMSDADLSLSIGTNLTGAILIAQEAHEYLVRSSGSLLFFASSSYTRGRANYSVYSATKAAIVNLTQALAEEWAPDSVRVNCLNPARTGTPMRTDAFGAEDPDTLLESEYVASVSAKVLASAGSGQIFDVKLPGLDPLARLNPSEGA